MSTKKKKVLSLFLALVMVFSLLPGAALAAKSSTSADTPLYRIVHLDCGRKYFSVENIKKLIDTMAQYGYNQLQLAFGNGGCRFLLDDMSLSFEDSSNETVEMISDTVKANITNGNYAFNGDTRYLTEAQMDDIIAYATAKDIDIVPMLNMPGHATAIVHDTSYASNGNLDVASEVARNYGYALLGKYVEYFKGKGCKFFHFGSDESGYTGTNMTTFLSGCAKVITDAGMTPRAFNDATNVATMPKSVQITYWHQESGSQTASALARAGYQMINTHGRWYYVIKTAQNSEIGTKYWQGTVNSTATSVELPVLKATKMDKKWVGINEYFDGNPGYGSTIPGSLGTMFCIWCDASQDAYLTDSDVISENENYGALYQLEKLAEQYWPDDIKTKQPPVITLEGGEAVPATMTNGSSIVLTADKSVTWKTSNDAVIALTANESLTRSGGISAQSVTAQAKGTGQATITATDDSENETSYTITVQDASAGTTRDVTLTVGESATFDVGNADGKDYITGAAAYIATASVTQGQAQAAGVSKVTSIESGKTYLITNYRNNILLTNQIGTYNSYNYYYNALTLSGTPNTTSDEKWTITSVDGGYTIQDRSHKYLTIGYHTASVETTKATLALTYDTAQACWTIAQDVTSYYGGSTTYYLNQLGGADARVAGGYTDGVSDEGSRWYIYEVTEGTPATNTLTITATGEGTTTVTVGDVTYNITVTAPSTTETKVLSYNGEFTLPTGATAELTSGSGVTIENGKVVAGNTDANATVTAVVTNGGGKVTARYVYNITVSAIDLSDVDPLAVELWVTNRCAGGTHNGITYAATAAGHIVSISAEAAYGPDGVALESLVPTTGADERSLPLLYWKGTRLASDNKQTYTGDDMSGKGSDFQKVRYYEGFWQYYFNGTWTSIQPTDQIIAYYMQVYNTSPEIVTAFRDYGGIAGDGGGEYDASWFAGYRGVGTAVVYPDKSMSPNGDTGIWNNTLICYYEGASGGGNPGLIKVFDTEDFKITKITITKGVHKDSTGKTGANATKTWNRTTSSVRWDKTTNDAGDEWYDETVIWTAEGHTAGETITLDDSIWGNTWKTSGIGEAFLLLFYVEPVEKEDNLTVIYWDDNANTRINPDPIQISVKDGVTFINGIKQTSPVNAGTFTLDDDATIENSVGTSRGFNKNITILEGVSANYRSGIYRYVGADISTDGKTLTLHYDIKAVEGTHTYVVDYGLPVNFSGLLKWFHVESADTVDYLSVARANKLTVSTGKFGSIAINMGTWDSMTYTLDKPLDAAAYIPLYCKLTDGTQLETQIRVIPATTMYYEQDFGAKFVTYSEGWSDQNTSAVSTSGTIYQALNELGSKANYGYDSAYNAYSQYSLDSAKKVTVNAEMLNRWNPSTSSWPTATFDFKGTGFDIISLTNTASGQIFVTVTKKANGEPVKKFTVNNYYGYEYKDGTWTPTPDSNKALYQVPVMKVTGLVYGEYTAEVKVAYSPIFDKTGRNEYSFWLDAIRIYDPAGRSEAANSDYGKDDESYPTYQEIRDVLIKQKDFGVTDGNSGAVFIDGKKSTTSITDYQNFGPNNETYLTKNQAIAFRLVANAKPTSVQLGIKLAQGSNGVVNVTVDGQDGLTTAKTGSGYVFSTATDMYYKLADVTNWTESNGTYRSPVIIITNASEDDNTIISLTNIKVTGGATFTKEVTDVISNTSAQPMIALFSNQALVDLAQKALVAEPVQPSGGGGGGSTGGVISSDPTNVPGSDWKNPYDDVKDGSWYYDYVKTVTEAGLMNGQGSGFGPDGKLTRAMMVTILYRMSGSPAVTGVNPFTDVPAGTWYSDAVLWAYDKGIVKGTSETTFAPTADITRQDMATIIARYAAAFQIELKAADGSTFSDDSAIAGYAKDAVYSMKASGILSGKGNDRFDPQGTTTRAETAKVIALLHAI